MKTILSSRRDHYLAKFSIFLITVALIAGMVGCDTAGFKCYLTIAITEGGTVMRPSEGTFAYYEGKVVNLMAQAEKGYKFVEWTGDVDTINDVNDDTTTITMNGNYSITANFALEIIEIWDWDDLDDVRNNLGSNYLLMNPLGPDTIGYKDLASLTANGGDGWQPIGIPGTPFTGSFDGQGYEIRDMSINSSGKYYVGLFGYVGKGGVVKNVTAVNATATGKDNVGGLVGWNGGTVSNSYSTGSVTGKDDVGGLVGWNEGTVSDSYSTGTVTGEDYVGGLAGGNTGTVSNSYSTSSVSGESYVGGLVGYNYEKSTVSNSYANGSVTGNSLVGGLVGKNYNESTVSDSYSTGNVTGDVGVGGLIGFNDKSKVSNSHYNRDEVLVNGENIITIGALFGKDFDQWLANDKFLDVNGRLSQDNDYYLVNNVNDFKELLAFGQNSSLKFRLKTDLDLATEPNFYIPYFAGEFDGNSHKISNLSFNFDFAYNVGLFGYLAPGGRVTRVGVENVNITGASFVGGLVGYNWEGTLKDSYSSGNVSGDDWVGGLVGSNQPGTVEYCNSTGSVNGNRHVGGLAGYNYKEGTVSYSNSTGSVTGNSLVGGLVGSNEGTVSKSYFFTGSVTGGNIVGGLVGENEAIVSESCSTGNLSGHDKVGGLVGRNNFEVSNSYSTNNVTGYNRVGGLVGINDGEGTVNRSYSTGNVNGDYNVGGLVGKNNGEVSRSFWDTETSGQNNSDVGTPKNTTQMKDINTFTVFDIWAINPGEPNNTHYTWNIINGQTYPFLSELGVVPP